MAKGTQCGLRMVILESAAAAAALVRAAPVGVEGAA
jgi:hypothetical protein